MRAFEGAILSNQTFMPPGAPVSMMGSRSPSACMLHLLPVSLCLLLYFSWGVFWPGWSLNLSSSLAFSPLLPVDLRVSGHPVACPFSPGLRAGDDFSVLQVHPHHHGAYPQQPPPPPPTPPVESAPVRPGPRPYLLFLVPGLPHPTPGWDRGGLLQHPGLLHVQHLTPLLSRVRAQPQHVLEGEL